MVDLSLLGEQTLFVDCDVLQADGGTRVASICAASLALEQAQTKLLASGAIKAVFLKESVAAVSVGVVRSEVLLDPDSVSYTHLDVYKRQKAYMVLKVFGCSLKRRSKKVCSLKPPCLTVHNWYKIFNH